MAATVVQEIKQRVDKRLAELEPLVAEYQELLAVKDGLGDGPSPGQSRNTTTARQAGARRRGRAAAKAGRGKTGRAKPGRAEQALALIGATPGITVKEIAAHMKINDNYLYRLLPRMEKEGQIKRKGKGWTVK